MRLTSRWAILTGVAVVVLAYWGGGSTQPVLATGEEAEATGDGLHRLDPRIMQTAWVKPDLNLEHYTKILIMPSIASFREVSGRYHPRGGAHQGVFPISEQDQDRFRLQFGEVFHEYAVQLKPYEVSQEVGREVLMVRGLMVDVISGSPPSRFGSNTTFVNRPWEVTAMIELRDSMSDEVLARSMDRLRIDGVFDVTEVPEVTRRAMHEWSEVMLVRLRELVEVGGGRWSRCQQDETDCAL